MLINKAISKIMKEKKFTQAQMARGMGLKKATNIGSKLTHTNLYTDSVIEMLDLLGYELVIQEKRVGKRREDQIVIDKGEER